MTGENKMSAKNGERDPLMGGSFIAIIAIIIIIIAVGLVYFKSNQQAGSANDKNLNQASPAAPEVKIFNFDSISYKYSLTEIRVKKGDRVRINLTVLQGMHDWVVDEFNAKTKVLTEGQSDSVEFTADRSGTFEYYCSVGNHRQMGMVGKLIVE